MTKQLLETFGMYGGAATVAFIAGLFPLFSIEVFLVGLTAVLGPTVPQMLVCCLLAALGHQAAKTITYYAGVGALESGKLKAKLDQVRPKIEKWNKAPRFVLFLAGAIGIPPLYIVGFIARPLMGIGIVTFTLIVLGSRFGRFVVLAAIPLLL
jgi:membrane protein YqaA with SNARE-associated domain